MRVRAEGIVTEKGSDGRGEAAVVDLLAYTVPDAISFL